MRRAAYVTFMAALAVLINRIQGVSAQGQNVTLPVLKDLGQALNTTQNATQGLINATEVEETPAETRSAMLLSDPDSRKAAARRKKPKRPEAPPAKGAIQKLAPGNCAYVDTKLANGGLIMMEFPAGRTIIIDTTPTPHPNHNNELLCKVIYLKDGEKLSDNKDFRGWYDYQTRTGRALPIKPGSMLRIISSKAETINGDEFPTFTVEVVTKVKPTKNYKWPFKYQATWSFSGNVGAKPAEIPSAVLAKQKGVGFEPGIQQCPAVGTGPGYPIFGRLLESVQGFMGAGQVKAGDQEVINESELGSGKKSLRHS